ncbi:serine/threonine-protein kinase [Actinomadura decatromicini]|uniref:non-specific serine/threonine protein kinase n=1 Tax=Actinomadura decatromicini TaxID=2604572 RepID=A0A5D3FZ49_9ACTN|nr:serine/threonine-protein kinase [Actinomadura decatromicini]TYK53289.1 serine/threonine protein kinase [Actinomadura decatromicini]
MNDAKAATETPGDAGRRVPMRPRSDVVPDAHVRSQVHEAARGRHARPGPGHLLGDRYQLVERLGQGGMGTVWKGRDLVIGRDVAVKEPRLPKHVPDEDRHAAFARLEREARAAAQIDHPSIVRVHDVVSVDDQPWIIMELIRGRSLAEILAEGTLPPMEAARIALPVVDALVATHARKVLHRDVKPANIMIEVSDRIVLTDFGIASIEGERPLTQEGTLIGSPEYTAPERILGHLPGPASDFFSLGVLLYTAIEGFSPFLRQTWQATHQAVLRAEPPPPSQAGALSDLIMALLNKEPHRRPPSDEIIYVLEKAASPQTLLIGGQRPDQSQTSPINNRRSWRRSAIAVLTASVVTGAAVAAVMWPGGSGQTASNVPQGWKVHHKLGASIAVPGNYKARDLFDHGGGVVFQTEEGQVNRELILLRWDLADGPPEARATYWYRQFASEPKFTDRQITLSDAVVNGRKSKVLTMTYRPEDGGLWRKKEVYYNADGQLWKLIFDSAITNEQDTGGDEILEAAMRTFTTD